MCPNWCSNIVTIEATPEQIQEILNAIRWEWLFMHFIPRTKEVEDDWKLEEQYSKLNSEQLKELWFNERPYKQLWYDRQINNRWAKWDMQQSDYDNYSYNEWSNHIEIFYQSPRVPHLKWREAIAKKFKCFIEVQYSEEWQCFSWVMTRDKWEKIWDEEYDDAFYGNWKRCEMCGQMLDWNNPDDWCDDENTVCIYCEPEYNKKLLADKDLKNE